MTYSFSSDVGRLRMSNKVLSSFSSCPAMSSFFTLEQSRGIKPSHRQGYITQHSKHSHCMYSTRETLTTLVDKSAFNKWAENETSFWIVVLYQYSNIAKKTHEKVTQYTYTQYTGITQTLLTQCVISTVSTCLHDNERMYILLTVPTSAALYTLGTQCTYHTRIVWADVT